MNSHYEELIERLYKHYSDYGEGRTQNFFGVCLDCKEAANALTALTEETAQLRSELEQVKQERDAAISERILPILFNTDMVKSILDGQKTATRRAVEPPALYNIVEDEKGQCVGSWYEDENGGYCYPTVDDCPYQPGNILYVQETWCLNNFGWHYRADWPGDNCPDMGADDKWHPSIHMPKEAARLFLRVTDVRVERLQDMTEDDALAEGFDPICPYEHRTWVGSPYNGGYESMCWAEGDCHNPERWCDKFVTELFGINVWNSTIKKVDLPRYGWAANPWVWVIEFEQIRKDEVYGTTK